MLLSNLHAHESCVALLPLLLYPFMLYSYGLPFVVGLPLLLFIYVYFFFFFLVFSPACALASMCTRYSVSFVLFILVWLLFFVVCVPGTGPK